MPHKDDENQKKRAREKRARKVERQRLEAAEQAAQTFVNPNFLQKAKLFFKKWWVLTLLLLVTLERIVTISDFKQVISDIWTTQQEKDDAENFRKGSFEPIELPPRSDSNRIISLQEKPPVFMATPIRDSFPSITGIQLNDTLDRGIWLNVLGNTMFYDSNQVREGVPIYKAIYSYCMAINMYFKVFANRLFISVELKDIEKQEFIGIIEYNRWRLFRPNLLTYHEDSQSLEVIDKQNHVVCSITRGIDNTKNTFNVFGYFFNDRGVSVLTNTDYRLHDCLYEKTDSNWKQKALMAIATIKPVFKYSNR